MKLDASCQEEVADVVDARHVGGELLAVLYVQPEELVELGKDCLVTGGSIGGAEDGDHFKTLADEVVTGVEVCRSVTRDLCIDGGAELATLGGVGCIGFEIGCSRRKGRHLHGVGEGAVLIEPVVGGAAERLELETMERSLERNVGCRGLEASVDALYDDSSDIVHSQGGGDCGGGYTRRGRGKVDRRRAAGGGVGGHCGSVGGVGCRGGRC